MSSNPQGRSWFSDKVLVNITIVPHFRAPCILISVGQPKLEPPFRGAARIHQAKQDYIPDDWENDDGDDGGGDGDGEHDGNEGRQTAEPIIPSTMLQQHQAEAEADPPAQPAQSQGKIKPPMCVREIMPAWLLQALPINH